MIPRTYPTGERFNPAIAYIEYQKYLENYLESDNPVYGDWTPLGPTTWVNGASGYNPGNGRINCVTVDPNNPNIIYVGAPAGGIWKSINNGNNWTVLSDDFTVLGVSSIAIHPGNSNVIYIATGDGDGGQTYSIGVLKSIDAGLTWTTTGLSFFVTNFVRMNKILIHPTNPNILIAAANNGFYKSTNAGVNWIQTVSGTNIRDIEFKPSDPNTIYAAGTSFRKSTDGGDNFTTITSGIPSSGITRMAIGVSPANSNYVYFLASASNGGYQGYYRSTNSGVDFTVMSGSPNILGYELNGSDAGGQGTYDLVTAVSPTDINTVYTGGINVWKSTNGGTNFISQTYWYYPDGYSYVHADIHALEFFGSRLFTGSDGGVFYSTNNGTNWIDRSPGLDIMQFYRIGGTPSNANFIIGGTQDNGSNIFKNGILTHIFGADGGEAIIDYTDTNIVYCEYQGGGILKSTNGGVDLNDATAGITGTGAFITPYIMHPTDHLTLFAGFQNVWKTTDGADSWTQLSTALGSGTITSLAISPSDPGYIYTSKTSNIYVTTDDGGNWNLMNSGLPGFSVTYIAVHSTDPNTAWASISGYNSGQKVFKTTNAGMNWTNISGSLPNIPANCVTYENGPKEGVYVGMDVGVYYINNQLSDWVPYFDGMPNVIVREIEIHYPTGKVRAGTLGRGLWQASLASQTVGVQNSVAGIPNNFYLKQNYPNPFNPVTKINYDLPKPGYVSIKIYDGLGKEVANIFEGDQNAGSYSIDFNGNNLSSGTYFYRMEASINNDLQYAMTKKMVRLK
ncbi:MAG: T9SS type A sorting domain-containing protein [Ignavibacteria bacterium]|nr:T9SS type A sorting domain-containing protein [Ignavibacteria bacterium]